MNLTIIAAIGMNRELGYKNTLIWHLKGDMHFFKENTTNHTIIMGYNTLKSLPHLLPNRRHIVITHKDIKIPSVEVIHSIDELNKLIKDEEAFIIGGSTVYKETIDIANKLLLTEIQDTFNQADVYFPKINKDNYNIKILKENEENGIKYNFVEYKRKIKH